MLTIYMLLLMNVGFIVRGIQASNTARVELLISDNTGTRALYDSNLKTGPTIRILNSTNGAGEEVASIQAKPYNSTFSKAVTDLTVNNTYIIEVYWLGVKVYHIELNITSTDTRIIIAKTNTTLVQIKLFDSRGVTPLENATVNIYKQLSLLASLTSNENGVVEVLLPYGTYRIGEIYWGDINVKPSQEIKVEVDAEPYVHISINCAVYDLRIVVKNLAGEIMISGVQAKLFRNGVLLSQLSPTTYGDIFFKLLPVGTYVVRIEFDGSLINETIVFLDEDKYIQVTAEMFPQVTIYIVDGDNVVVKDAYLRKIGSQILSPLQGPGQYTLPNVFVGKYEYIVEWHGKNFTGSISINKTTVYLKLPLFSLTIDVASESTLNLAEFSITVTHLGIRVLNASLNQTPIKVSRLEPGVYHLTVKWYDYTILEEDFTIHNSTFKLLRLPLHKLRMRIVDLNDQVLGNASFLIKLPNGTSLFLQTNEDGFTETIYLPEAQYYCTVIWRGVEVYEETILLKEDLMKTIKTSVGSYIIYLKDLWGNPIRGARVFVYIILSNGTKILIGNFTSGDGGEILLLQIPLPSTPTRIFLMIKFYGKDFSKMLQIIGSSGASTYNINLDVVAVLLGYPINLLETVIILTIIISIIVGIMVIKHILEERESGIVIIEGLEQEEKEGLLDKIRRKLGREKEEF
ncbi:MAG: hypothetical protein DRJ47_07110 [Thermoprotei archaeon]|nr:MAG: hypothetical protein DRJ47_07110 [Thermoprotei archaeon]